MGTKGQALVEHLKGMRAEVDGWMMGKDLPEARGGERGEDVVRPEGAEGGLYRD